MTTHRVTKLESLIKRDVDLYSEYHIVKEKAAEIIKWSPPVDPDVPELPPYYTDHGMEHSQRILAILDRLTERLDIEIFEAFPLLCSVWLHDIGMFVGREPGEPYETTRKLHHLRTGQYVKQETETGRLPIDQWQLPSVGFPRQIGGLYKTTTIHFSGLNTEPVPLLKLSFVPPVTGFAREFLY